MHKPLLAACGALALSACMGSTSSTRPSSPRPIPPALLAPCSPTAAHRQPDGSTTSADDEATIRDGRFDLRACDDKRRLAVEGWPG